MARYKLVEDGVIVNVAEFDDPAYAASCGYVTATDDESVPPDLTWDDIRRIRDELLVETDIWALADGPTMSQADIDYRAALRNVPQDNTDPNNVTWPSNPRTVDSAAGIPE
jgi:hypothetical protein